MTPKSDAWLSGSRLEIPGLYVLAWFPLARKCLDPIVCQAEKRATLDRCPIDKESPATTSELDSSSRVLTSLRHCADALSCVLHSGAFSAVTLLF
jgi:hypothetical protein